MTHFDNLEGLDYKNNECKLYVRDILRDFSTSKEKGDILVADITKSFKKGDVIIKRFTSHLCCSEQFYYTARIGEVVHYIPEITLRRRRLIYELSRNKRWVQAIENWVTDAWKPNGKMSIAQWRKMSELQT